MKNIPKGHQFFYEDLKEYEGLNKEERKYIERFYDEMYKDEISFSGAKILKSPDMIAEARRNHNSVKRDAMSVATRTSRKLEIESVDTPESRDFMQDTSLEEVWLTAYKIGGYELGAKTIIIDTKRRIELKECKIETLLINMLREFRKLRNVYRKDKREAK